MARPLRIELAGGVYHVTSRGDRREAIYRSDEDRAGWLAVLGQACARFNWRCHAWCQMTNHFHMVLETPDANLSQGMRQLNGVYTQQFNRRHALVGHLFQGRFKAILVERETYLLELARYVVLNPVRAGMVARPDDWSWSSYRAMVAAAPTPEWLETDWLLGQFGDERAQAQAGYAAFVVEGIGQPSIWKGLRHQILLGSERFVEQRFGAWKPLWCLEAHGQVARGAPRAAAGVGQAAHRVRCGVPAAPRGHGACFSDRSVFHAGDRGAFPSTLLDGQPGGKLARWRRKFCLAASTVLVDDQVPDLAPRQRSIDSLIRQTLIPHLGYDPALACFGFSSSALE